MKTWHAATLLLVLAACGRTDRSGDSTPPAASLLLPTTPWTWHPIGGIAVIEGEVAEPTELLLEGRSIRERRFAEPGPVRWEFYRPPAGESAVLRTTNGRELARFEFSLPPARPQPGPAARRWARRPEPSATAAPSPGPLPQAPAPKVHAEARPSNTPVPLIPDRHTQALPSTSEAPAGVPRRAFALPKLLEPVVPAPRVRAEARLANPPVPLIPGRKTQALPSTSEAAAGAPRRAFVLPKLFEPVIPAPRVRVEARLRNTPDALIPGRKPFALPSATEAPVGAPGRTFAIPLLDPVAPPPLGPTHPPASSGATAIWPGMGEALNLTRGPGGRKRLLLSFDGGSTSEVAAEILDLLKARGIHTTLFLTGAFIHRFPALVKRMAAEGHELGNHTMNHPHFAPDMKRDSRWTRERVQRELLDADAALVSLLGRPMDPYWRAPYGEHTAEIRRWAEELGYRHVGWSEGADTLDWATPKDRRLYRSGEAIVQRLQKRLDHNGDGLIVLMHLGSERRPGDRPTDGLGAFMDQAQKEGWTFVSVGTFLRDLGKPAWDSHQRLAFMTGSPAQGR